MDTTILTVLNKIGEIGRFAAGEYKSLQDVDKQVEALRSGLQFWMAWAQEAEEGNIAKRDGLVSVWESHIRGAVFKAEDIVDEYQGVYSRPGFESRAREGRSCVPCFPLSEVPLRYALHAQIEELLGRLEELKKDRLSDMQSRVVAQASNMEDFDKPTMGTLVLQPPTRIEDVIGFDDYTKNITSVLLNEEGKRGAIVMGESGIGKTAAARAVLRDWDIQRHFDVCAWACLPPKSRVDRYLDQIWEQAQEQTHCECDSPRREDVKQVLDKLKLLVVLDGMDDKDELMEVLRGLPDGANGSRVVVTTQLPREEINQLIHDHDYLPVEIKCLGPTHCEEFLDKMFSGSSCSEVYKSNKKDFDDKIYSISGGLPLGIVLLGGLLYFKDHEKQWNDVFEQLKTYEGMRLIKRILTLSYLTMPTILRLCFLYFASMPPNVHLDLKKLHRLWCAEGIPESEIKDMETEKSVLDRCVRVLVSLGLVQRVDADTKVCIHQSVHSFAKDRAHKTGFMESHSRFDIPNVSTVRRLSVRNYDDKHVLTGIPFHNLRTLVGDFLEDSDDEVAHHASSSQAKSTKGVKQSSLLKKQGLQQSRLRFLCQSRFLRVVDLQGVQIVKLPDSIGDMVHLRYLGLRSCCLKYLPRSVAKLLNLETLDVTDNEVDKIPKEFWKIDKLRHVLAKNISLPESAISAELVNKIQTLHGVRLSSEWTQQNCPLNEMSKLFSLTLVGATASNVEPLAKALEKTRKVRQLKIQGDCIPLLCSSKYQLLQYLDLDGKILSQSSSDSSDPITASKIVLKSSCMSQKLLNTFFSKHGYLNELELLDGSFSEKKLLLQGQGFANLTKLKLVSLKVLEELVLEESALPKLLTLEIFGCPNMKTIQGLKYSQELKIAVLFDMPAIVAQIKAEDKELFDKIKNVSSAAWASPT